MKFEENWPNRRLHMKFEENWPRGFRGEVVQRYGLVLGIREENHNRLLGK